ncbi:uncharacterized protein LOC126410651 [Nymphaea colorata]|nr:uncharacterized protein LOC126410651 [Nymphaea colorata]
MVELEWRREASREAETGRDGNRVPPATSQSATATAPPTPLHRWATRHRSTHGPPSPFCYVKNVVPEHASNVVIFVDSINLIFEESTKRKPFVSLPFACIEPGDDHSLPNIALRWMFQATTMNSLLT